MARIASSDRRKPAPQNALSYALRYAKEDIRCIWIPGGTKAPIAKGWPALATTDAVRIKQWAVEHPGCNFGLVMGGGIVAVDVDDPAVLPDLAERGLLVPTREHRTPSGGSHFLFRVPDDAVIKNAVRILDGVDIRSTGGQIVGPGGVHPSGGIYAVEDDSPIADAPAELLELLTTKPAPKATTSTRGTVGEGGRNAYLTSMAGSIHRRGTSPDVLKAELHKVNTARCNPPLPDAEVDQIAESVARYPLRENVEALLNSDRPRIMLPSDNRLLADFAAEIGDHLGGEVYLYNRTPVRVIGGKIHTIGAQEFRSLVERRVICCKERLALKAATVSVGVTMSEADARGTLASPQFHEKLVPLSGVATCRRPVLRSDGRIELLPEGYDVESQTLTVSNIAYRDDMKFDKAKDVLKDLFSEFTFVNPRDLSVAVAALLGLFAQPLLHSKALRPMLLYVKNAEGAGATTCAACAIVTVTGDMPTGTAPGEDDEMRKLLTSSLREGCSVVLLDNCKRTIGGVALEAFVSSPKWRDRLLGVNQIGDYDNNATVFATGNGATCTPDIRRRSLQCELHLGEERAEDKVFQRTLNVSALLKMRSELLAACWSLVTAWDKAGRPGPSRSHSGFPEWAVTIGGIVQHAGFGCALETPESSIAVDEDAEAMHELVDAMGSKPGVKHAAREVFGLCRVRGVFLHLVGASDLAMKNDAYSTMGKILARYRDRLVGEWRFMIEGKGHQKRFYVEAAGAGAKHGRTVKHDIPPELLKQRIVAKGGRPCKTVPPCSKPSGDMDLKFDRAQRRTLRLAARAAETKRATRPTTR
jgi:hypothetical protein